MKDFLRIMANDYKSENYTPANWVEGAAFVVFIIAIMVAAAWLEGV